MDTSLVEVMKIQYENERTKPVTDAQAKFWEAQALRERGKTMKEMGITVDLTEDQKDKLIEAFAKSIEAFVK